MRLNLGTVAGLLFMAGETARQMVNAPKPTPPAAAPDAPAAPAAPVAPAGNRFAALFCEITYKAASLTTKQYDNNDGSKGKKIANVTMGFINPLTGQPSGAVVQGQIKAVQAAGAKNPLPVFTFQSSLTQGQCIKADDASAMIELDAFVRWVANVHYMSWRKQQGKTAPVVPVDAAVIEDLSL